MNDDIKILQVKHIANLYDWYNFVSKKTGSEKDTSILIVGDAGENLCIVLSKRVKAVTCFLETMEYFDDYNYLNLPKNIDIQCYDKNKKSDNEDFKSVFERTLTKKFDYILFTGITERIFSINNNSLKDFVFYIEKNFLEEDGDILLAFDNKISLDVIAGEKLDEEYVTFSYQDIIDLKNNIDSEKKKIDIYFPMPEFRFPIRLYSEKYEPSLEDEDKKTRNLVKYGIFSQYAKSYILVYKNNIKVEKLHKESKIDYNKLDTIYVKYNIDRVKRFALRTSIKEDDKGERYIIKKAIYEEANQHIESMPKRLTLIENKLINMVNPLEVANSKDTEDNRSYIIFPYIKGESVSDVVLKKLSENNDLYETIDSYMNLIIGQRDGLIKTYNLDCTFNNALVNDGKIYIIDGEWIDDNTTEVSFLRYRILKYFYSAYKQDINVDTFQDFINLFHISKDDMMRYEEAENNFQSLVHENINILDTNKYKEIRPGVSQIYVLKQERDRIKDQLERITGEKGAFDYHANKQNEILRLTNVHVTNLENIIKAHESEINELNKVVEFYRSKESILWKVLSKIKQISKKFLKPEKPLTKIVKYIYRTIRHPFKMMKTFFTNAGRNRIMGDFLIGDAYFESGKVSFPTCPNPKVSIVIPCYNQIQYTYRCLYSIMKNTNVEETPYEVILADDNSSDTTKNIKKFVDNIVVSRNEENLGFLKNCNKAATLAKGEYIYFLNNDTEVKEGYLSSLVNLIENDKTIGLVGSKLIFEDGILQEAGGIIYNDGTGANYGRGDNPTDFKYNYVKDVDYISGASILLRRSLWNEIGGFDERYTPAYCEDSDLCFEIRSRGYRVVYQPLSEIIHYEGKSCGTDENDTNSIKSYQVVNNEKLREKWETELFMQSPITDIYHARERSQDKKIVLFIDHYVPTWDKDAGSKTTFAYIKMFIQKGYQVKFLGDNYILNEPYGNILQQMGVEVLYGVNIQTNIWEYLKENRRNIDFVYLNRPHIAVKYIDYIRENMKAKVIFYGHDLHYLRLKREFDITGDNQSLYESKYYRSLEYSLIYKADMTYYPSHIEIDEIKKVDEKLKCKAISAYIYDEVSEDEIDFTKRENLLFVGGFSHTPNVDALKWFDDAIMPRIKSRREDIKLVVVGSNATPEILEICEKDYIIYKGFVSDEELMELYDKSRIVVAPLRYGAGIKGKIIEAMAKGSAIITTEVGAEGIEKANKFMKIADGALDFSNAIVKLYDDTETLAMYSKKARQVINSRFTIESVWGIIKDDFA